MEEKTPQQELVELRAALKGLPTKRNRTLKYVMRIIEEEYGENVVKKLFARTATEQAAEKDEKVKVTALCKLFGLSRQAYYKRSRRTAEIKKREIRLSNLLNNREY